MINTNFRLDKNDLITRFKKYIMQYQDSDELEFEPEHGKDVSYSKLNILKKVQKIYEWILKEVLLQIRQNHIHDDNVFNQVKGGISNYIRNKIRSASDGSIYLKVPDLVTFNGDIEQYHEWVVKNKKNQERLLRKIIDELNNFLEGEKDDDNNKPILNDEDYQEIITLEDTMEYLTSKLDEIIDLENESDEEE